MFDWAYITGNPNSTNRKHCHYLLYKVPATDNGIYPVSVRLQGVIVDCALSGLGTWNGFEFLTSNSSLISAYVSPEILTPLHPQLISWF